MIRVSHAKDLLGELLDFGEEVKSEAQMQRAALHQKNTDILGVVVTCRVISGHRLDKQLWRVRWYIGERLVGINYLVGYLERRL